MDCCAGTRRQRLPHRHDRSDAVSRIARGPSAGVGQGLSGANSRRTRARDDAARKRVRSGGERTADLILADDFVIAHGRFSGHGRRAAERIPMSDIRWGTSPVSSLGNCSQTGFFLVASLALAAAVLARRGWQVPALPPARFRKNSEVRCAAASPTRTPRLAAISPIGMPFAKNSSALRSPGVMCSTVIPHLRSSLGPIRRDLRPSPFELLHD
jgi:hypothetical protein